MLNTSVVRLYQVLTTPLVSPAIKYKYLTEFLTFSIVFQLLSWTHKIRMFFCNVLCIRATKLCLRRRLPLCCWGDGEGIGDNLGHVICALGFRVPLPYRQHQHKHWGQVLNCFPFSDLYAFSWIYKISKSAVRKWLTRSKRIVGSERS